MKEAGIFQTLNDFRGQSRGNAEVVLASGGFVVKQCVFHLESLNLIAGSEGVGNLG